MNNLVFILYNVLAKRYSGICEFSTDEYATHVVREQLTTRAVEYQLFRVGSISVESGELTSHAPVLVCTFANDPITESVKK